MWFSACLRRDIQTCARLFPTRVSVGSVKGFADSQHLFFFSIPSRPVRLPLTLSEQLNHLPDAPCH